MLLKYKLNICINLFFLINLKMPLTEIELFNHPIYQDYACNIHTGDIYSLKNNQVKLMSQPTDSKGYFQITLCKENNKKLYRSHRFIYECYHNKILPKNICVDHIDRNRKNNNINNLREVNNFTNSLNKSFYLANFGLYFSSIAQFLNIFSS